MINLLYNRLSMNHADPDGSWHAKTELCHRKICVWFADIHDFRMFVCEERHNTLSTPLKPMGIVRSTERVAWPRMMRFASSARPCSRLLHWLVQQHWACCFCNRQSLPSATRGTNLTAFFNFYTGHPVCKPSLLLLVQPYAVSYYFLRDCWLFETLRSMQWFDVLLFFVYFTQFHASWC